MKIARITTLYNDYLERFYQSKAILKNLSFIEQKKAIDHDSFGWGDGYKLAEKLYDLMVLISFPIAIIMTIFADKLVYLCFGPNFSEANEPLKIYIWAGIFSYLGVASSKWLIAENLTTISFYRTFTGAILNILLNLVLIPKYGINGAALATLFTQSVVTYFYDLFNKKTLIAFKNPSH